MYFGRFSPSPHNLDKAEDPSLCRREKPNDSLALEEGEIKVFFFGDHMGGSTTCGGCSIDFFIHAQACSAS